MAKHFLISGFIRFKDEASAALGKVSNAIDGLKGRGDKLAGGFDKVGGAMAVAGAGGAAVGAGFAATIAKAANFSEALAIMNSVSDLSGDQFDQLRLKALALGSSTVFTATQVVGGMTELSKAGLDANQTMAAIPGVLAAAATEGLEMARASEIVVSVMQGQNLEAERATHVANVLAAAANASSAGMLDLGEAFKYANGLSQQGIMTFEQTAGALSVLANAGMKGSMAGTSLTSMFTQLTKPSKKVKDTFELLGLGQARFTDAAGKMLPLPDIINKVQGAVGLLRDDQEKLAFLQDLLGDAGSRAFVALRNSTTDATKEGNKGVSTYDRMVETARTASEVVSEDGKIQGAAAIMASKRLDQLKGDWENVSGAIDTVGISIGSLFLPQLRAATQAAGSFLGDIASNFVALSKPANMLTPEDIARLQTPAGQFVTGFVEGLKDAMATGKQLFSEIREGMQSILGGDMNPKELGRTVAQVLLLAAAVGPVIVSFLGFLAILGPVIGGLAGLWGIVSAFMPTAAALAATWGWLAAAGGILWMAVTTGTPLMTALLVIFPKLAGVTAAFGAAMAFLAANPVVLVIAGLVALGAAAYLLWNNWDTVSAFLVSTWNTVRDGVVGAIDWIMAKYHSLSNTAKLAVLIIGGLLTGGLLPIFFLVANNWDTITQAFGHGWAFVVSKFHAGITAVAPVLNWFTNAWGTVTTYAIAAWQSVVSFLSRINWTALIAAPFQVAAKPFASLIGTLTSLPGAETALSAMGISAAGLRDELKSLTTVGSFLAPQGPLAPVVPLPTRGEAAANLAATGTDGAPMVGPPAALAPPSFGAGVTASAAQTAAITGGGGAQILQMPPPAPSPVNASFEINVELDGEKVARSVTKRSIENAERRGVNLGPDTRSILKNGPMGGQVGVD